AVTVDTLRTAGQGGRFRGWNCQDLGKVMIQLSASLVPNGRGAGGEGQQVNKLDRGLNFIATK
ncbi:MAG: hypothetical protein L0312_23435, partial [Acidobacteria bacterium]|nr:hypothetical protein [Acidobacteriota bacterium]